MLVLYENVSFVRWLNLKPVLYKIKKETLASLVISHRKRKWCPASINNHLALVDSNKLPLMLKQAILFREGGGKVKCLKITYRQFAFQNILLVMYLSVRVISPVTRVSPHRRRHHATNSSPTKRQQEWLTDLWCVFIHPWSCQSYIENHMYLLLSSGHHKLGHLALCGQKETNLSISVCISLWPVSGLIRLSSCQLGSDALQVFVLLA